MAMHQDLEDPEVEIERAIGLGLRGMKLHPDTQKVDMDDPRLMSVYEMIAGRLPLIVHTGDYRTDFSHPRRLKNILHTFPDLVVDAAHFGGWSIPEIGYDVLHDENVFIDVSSSLAFLGNRRTRELVSMWGADRVMFGSDFPMWDPAHEYDTFTSLGFSDGELGENALEERRAIHRAVRRGFAQAIRRASFRTVRRYSCFSASPPLRAPCRCGDGPCPPR